MNVLGVGLLVVGYPVAVVVLARLRPVLRERRRNWFVALEVGTACIAVGWLLLGRASALAINGVALVAFAYAWVRSGRRRRPAPGPGAIGPGS